MIFEDHDPVGHTFAGLAFVRFTDGKIIAAIAGFLHIEEIILTACAHHLGVHFVLDMLLVHVFVHTFGHERAAPLVCFLLYIRKRSCRLR